MSDLDPRREVLARYKVRSVHDIERAFQMSEVTEPLFFFGRKEPVGRAVEILATPEKNGVIFGERGIGKSSLGHFMMSIARGNLEPLEYYGGRERLERRGKTIFGIKRSVEAISYNTVWIPGGELDSINSLFDKLSREIAALFDNGEKKKSFQLALNAQVLGTGGGVQFGMERERYDRPSLPPGRSGFEATIEAYRRAEPDRDLIIFIDEFDQVEHGEMIASQLKTQRRVRFVLIGIADSIGAIVSRHLSIARELEPIELKPMQRHELLDLIGGLLLALSDIVAMDRAQREILADISLGSPFICKGLLHHMVMTSIAGLSDFSSNTEAVDLSLRYMEDAFRSIGDIFTLYERLFQTAVADDPDDASRVLGGLATLGSTDAATLARSLGEDYSEEGISRFLVWLTKNGPRAQFVRRPTIRGGDKLAFADPVFRRFVRLRTAESLDIAKLPSSGS